MREKRKDPMMVAGFLLDRDVSKAASLFPAKITRTIMQVSLPDNTSDAAIVRKAWQLRRTIVTGNGDHFVAPVLPAARPADRPRTPVGSGSTQILRFMSSN